MYTRQYILTILALMIFSLFLGSIDVTKSQPCDDTRCRTGSCNITTGACICNLPHPSTILDGNRPFLGGKFCDEEMSMCDGTNSFCCGHGGECEEIVQGEIYKCTCAPGFSGHRCEHSGSACGRSFCYNGGQCLVEEGDDICQCPPGWRGSADCSLPTESQPDSSTNATVTKLTQKETSNHASWMVVVFAISCSAGAVAAGAVYIKKLVRKKHDTATNFQRLSQMQTLDLLDEDGSDDEESSIVTNKSHL